MSALATPVYRTNQTAPTPKPEDYTAAISAASTHAERLRLLAQKQEVEQALLPPRLVPGQVEKPNIYITRAGQDWRVILAKKQRQNRIRRRDCVAVADIEVTL